MHKINADVLGKFINIASRLGGILHKHCQGKLTTIDPNGKSLIQTIQDQQKKIEIHYNDLALNKAMMTIMTCADHTNKYIDENTPWSVAKENPNKAAQIITTGLNACRLIALYLKPVLPEIVNGIETFLNSNPFLWKDATHILENHSINLYAHLAERIKKDDLTHFHNMLMPIDSIAKSI